MLILEGIPLFLIELGIGQRMRLGSLGVWNTIHPWLGGIGISSCIVTLFVTLYYNVVITWCFFYLLNSFRVIIPSLHKQNLRFLILEVLECHFHHILHKSKHICNWVFLLKLETTAKCGLLYNLCVYDWLWFLLVHIMFLFAFELYWLVFANAQLCGFALYVPICPHIIWQRKLVDALIWCKF